jgi:predicted aspartyl protease
VPERRCKFDLVDGTVIERDVSECRFRYDNIEATSPVILGEKDDMPLLGVFTLESLGLVLDPYKRTLSPMHLILAGATRGESAPMQRP